MASFSTARMGVWKAKRRPLLPMEGGCSRVDADRRLVGHKYLSLKGWKVSRETVTDGRKGAREERGRRGGGERKGEKVQLGPRWKKFRIDYKVERGIFHLVCFLIFWTPLLALDSWLLVGFGCGGLGV